MRPTPEGVGVKGGGLLGDSFFSGPARRRLVRGVLGREGIVNSSSGPGFVASLLGSLVVLVVDTLLLRFLLAVGGLVTFSFFAVGSGARLAAS